jgi:TetR/AcrR family transcriptional repressor of nem operon
MKVSREQAAKNRAHVVDVAGAQFRQHGFDGIGIADLMKAAGLTHGGFYANFASKEDLAAEAAAKVLGDTAERFRVDTAGAECPLDAVIDTYVSPAHRDSVADGCMLSALAADAARGGDTLKQAFEDGIEKYLAVLTPMMSAPTEAERRKLAMATYAMALGGLIMSRAVLSPTLSDELLAAVAAQAKKSA